MKTNQVILTLRKCGICPKKEKIGQWNRKESSGGGESHVQKVSLQVSGKWWTIKCTLLQLSLSICKRKYNLFQFQFIYRLKQPNVTIKTLKEKYRERIFLLT